MNRVLLLCGAVLLALGLRPAQAAGPVAELYDGHLTLLADFDAGTVHSRKNGLRHEGTNWLLADEGLFGTKALVGGDFSYRWNKDRHVFDPMRPNTVLFLVKLVSEPKVSKEEPACFHFVAPLASGGQFLVFRQNVNWGNGTLAAFFECRRKAGDRYVARVDFGASFKGWKVGEWHLVAATCRSAGMGISIDGAPFKTVVPTEDLGPSAGVLSFGTSWGKDRAPGFMAMDDCAILDFALTDGQVRELWDEYQAQLKETSGADRQVAVTLEKCGAKGTTDYEIVLRAKNLTDKPLALRYAAKGRPRSSQPVDVHKSFTLRPGEAKTLALVGPALGDESVTADFGLVSEDKKTVFYRRHRVFAPHAPEPEWMREPSAVGFKFAYYPYENTIHAAADVRGCEHLEKLSGLTLSIFKKSEKKPVARKTFVPDKTGKTDLIWTELPELDGEYVCRLTGEGVSSVHAEQTFLRKRFAWEHNRLGLSGVVPAPFKKVETRGGDGERTVSVVHRDHLVDAKTELWKQVKAAGKDVLARPVSLVSAATSRPLDFSASHLAATAAWDVDGLMEWKLTLKPGSYAPTKLVIPVRKEIAWLYHACADGLRFNAAGRIPDGKGRVWDSTRAPRVSIVGNYVPYLWIGGTLRGVSVFGENDKGWVVDGKTPCLEICRTAESVDIVLNLIQKDVTLTEPRTIRLGFMATPVKPMPENWRSRPHGLLLGSTLCWGAEFDSAGVEPFDNTDEFFRVMAEERRTGKVDESYLRAAVDRYPYRSPKGSKAYDERRKMIDSHFGYGHRMAAQERQSGRLVFYTNGRGVHYGDPLGQGATFCNEWNRFEYFSRDITRSTAEAYDLDPVESFRDYAAWWYFRMLKTGACDYLYWDDVYMTPCFNVVQTDAYRLPTGQIQPSSGLFNMRALIRRCACIQAEIGREPDGNWVHMTNTAIAPICSFAGVNYDWEDISGEEPHQKKYPRDYILATTIGRQFGNRVGIMGYFSFSLDRKSDKYRWLDRTGTGVMLTHELRWNAYSGHETYEKYHGLLCGWGYRTPEVDVWNYWDEDVRYPLTVSGVENASIVMAKRAVNEAYVCVSSFCAEDGAVTVTPDAAILGLRAGWKAEDAETGREIPIENGALRLDLPKYDWRLVKLR